MTENVISVTTRRMGRPSLKVTPVLVRLPEGMPERIDAIAGKNKRAEFIREAVEKEVKRREREASKDGAKP